MSLEIRKFDIAGPLLITAKRFGDARGFFAETYSARTFGAAGIDAVFVQDNLSRSAEAGTIRGLHFQTPPHAQVKLLRAPHGRFLDVIVDIRKGSPWYGKHIAVELSAENFSQLLVPIGFAHGLCTLEPDTEAAYKVTDFYAPECDSGISWNDPALAIAWPEFAGAQVSAKDALLPGFAELDSPFVYQP